MCSREPCASPSARAPWRGVRTRVRFPHNSSRSHSMVTQQAIRQWFDRTYSEKGLTYLRPPEFYSVFMEYLAVKPGARLLDIGCGPGLLLNQATARGAFAVGIDVSQSGLSMVATEAPGAYCS